MTAYRREFIGKGRYAIWFWMVDIFWGWQKKNDKPIDRVIASGIQRYTSLRNSGLKNMIHQECYDGTENAVVLKVNRFG
ncbi:unnamed protein product [Eruca vesicaria subsp. sativa]|uniref:Uncharacterized protein n=1 Tax=Eruca vesicaria subsp. sativa TaxID=29727 RepID=A0ABC8M669_ERUVS|nr:unnamed protein product [Eruca vesicaria subsp. sativa]